MKKKYLMAAAAIPILVGLFFIFRGGKKKQVEITATVQEGPFEVNVTTPGELRAKNQTELTAPVSLRSLNIYQIKIADLVAEGTMVSAGDVVASLDKTEIMTKINEESINLQKMESEFKKAQLDTTLTLRQARDELVNNKYTLEQRKLEKEQSIYEAPSILRNAEIEYEKALRNYDQLIQNYKTKEMQAKTNMAIIGSDLSKAQAKLGALMAVLEELSIKAPIPGMVIYAKDWDGKKRVVGSTVSPWDPTVATLPDLSVMEVVTFVNEVDIQKVKDGQAVLIGLDSDPNKKLDGKVRSVATIGEQKPNSDAKVFEVVIDVMTRDTTLKPAMTTKCTIVSASLPSVRYVPLEAVYQQDGKAYVYKKESGKIIRQQVLLGVTNETSAVITEGLNTGETVLLTMPKDTAKIPFTPLAIQEPTPQK